MKVWRTCARCFGGRYQPCRGSSSGTAPRVNLNRAETRIAHEIRGTLYRSFFPAHLNPSVTHTALINFIQGWDDASMYRVKCAFDKLCVRAILHLQVCMCWWGDSQSLESITSIHVTVQEREGGVMWCDVACDVMLHVKTCHYLWYAVIWKRTMAFSVMLCFAWRAEWLLANKSKRRRSRALMLELMASEAGNSNGGGRSSRLFSGPRDCWAVDLYDVGYIPWSMLHGARSSSRCTAPDRRRARVKNVNIVFYQLSLSGLINPSRMRLVPNLSRNRVILYAGTRVGNVW